MCHKYLLWLWRESQLFSSSSRVNPHWYLSWPQDCYKIIHKIKMCHHLKSWICELFNWLVYRQRRLVTLPGRSLSIGGGEGAVACLFNLLLALLGLISRLPLFPTTGFRPKLDRNKDLESSRPGVTGLGFCTFWSCLEVDLIVANSTNVSQMCHIICSWKACSSH